MSERFIIKENDVIIAVTRELVRGEKRVSLCPNNVQSLIEAGAELWIEHDAGAKACFSNTDYQSVGAKIITVRDKLFAGADIILQVQGFGSNTENAEQDLKRLKAKQLIIGMMDPLAQPQAPVRSQKQVLQPLLWNWCRVLAALKVWMFFHPWQLSPVTDQSCLVQKRRQEFYLCL